jgi:hypothetical protein
MLPKVAPIEVALVVATGWIILILSRRWRPQPNWIDRAGRAFGLFWIVWGIIEEVEPWGFLEKDPYLKIWRLIQNWRGRSGAGRCQDLERMS